MPSINDIRLQFPDSTAGKTDLDIAADFAKFNNVPLERAAFDLGVSMPNAPGFASTLKRSAAQMTGGLGEIYGDVSGDHNNALATWSRGVEQRNPSGINSFQDIADNPGLALAEATANGLTFLVPAKGLQLAGQGLKAAKYLNAARAVDNPVSQAALAGLPSLAGIGEDQRASGQGENLLMKYGGAGVVGAIENLGGIQRLAGINRAAPGIQETVNSFGKTPWRTVGKTVGRSMLEEGAEELAQNPIEQWAGYKDPTTSQNMYETALGGAMGALGGLGFGAYHGGRSGMQHSAIRRDIATDLLNTEQSFGRQQNLAQWESAFRNKAGEDGQQWYGDFMNTQNDARLANTTTWNEPLAAYQQRVAEAGNPFMGEGPTADFVNSQLGIGQAPVQQHYASAYNQRLPEPVIVPDSNGNPITISTVGEAYDYQHGMGKFAPQQAKVDGVLTPVQQGTPSAPQTQQVAPQAVATPAAQAGTQQTAAPAAQGVAQQPASRLDAFKQAYGVNRKDARIATFLNELDKAKAEGQLTDEEHKAYEQKLADVWKIKETKKSKNAVAAHNALAKEYVDFIKNRAVAPSNLTDEEKAAAGWVKKITVKGGAEHVEWIPPKEKRATEAAQAEVPRVDPEDIENPEHEKAVRMHLAGDNLRTIAATLGKSHETWRKVLLDYGYDAKSKVEEDSSEAETGSAFTADETGNVELDGEPVADGSETDTSIDANPDIHDNDEHVDHSLENQGINIRSSLTKAGVGAGNDAKMQKALAKAKKSEDGVSEDVEKTLRAKNLSTETKLERQQREEREALQANLDSSRAYELSDKVANADVGAATELLGLLNGSNGLMIAQQMRAKFAMPASVQTPQAIVEFIAAKQAAAVAAHKAQFAEAAEHWGEGFDTLPEAAKLAFVDAMNGLGDLINTPSVLRQVKGDINNEFVHTEAVRDAEGVPSSDAQRPAGGRNDEGQGNSGQDQKAVPVVSKKKRRVAVADEAAGRSDSEGQAGEVTAEVDPRPVLELTGESSEDVLANETAPIFELQVQDGRQLTLDLTAGETEEAPYINPDQMALDFDAAPQETTTPEQRKQAQEHADSLGGVVAWQDGDIALLRGFSALTGQPIYAASNGKYRTRVAIDAYTGNLFTPDQRDELINVAAKLEAEAQEKHAAEPFAPFTGSNIGASKSVPPGVVGVVKGWTKLLGITANVYVTTVEDAKANIEAFTGPYRAISSAALNNNEGGSMRRLPNGDYYIAFAGKPSRAAVLETVAHELGHVHEREVFEKADAATKQAIRNEYTQWLAKQKGVSAKELVASLRARKMGKLTGGLDGLTADQLTSYWKSFGEWYADQVSRWANTAEKPVGVVETFFDKLGKALRSFYNKLVNEKYLPNKTFAAYLERANGASKDSQAGEVDGKLYRRETLVFTDSTGQHFSEEVESIDIRNTEDLLNALDDVAYNQLSGALDYVSGFHATDSLDAYAYPNGDGTYKIVLPRALLSGHPETLTRVLHHELAHVADAADAINGGKNSSGIAMGVMVQKAKALYDKLPANSKLKKHLEYPFHSKYPESGSAKMQRTELYAQLVSAYLDPELSAELRAVHPTLFNFAESIVNEIEEQYQEDAESSDAGVSPSRVVHQGNHAVVRQRGAASFVQEAEGKISELITNPKRFFSNLKLGFTTLEQIYETTKSTAVRAYRDAMVAMQATSKDIVSKASEIDRAWAELPKDAVDKLSTLMTETTRAQFDPSVDKPANVEQQRLATLWDSLGKDSAAQKQYLRVRDFYADRLKERQAIMEGMAKKAKLNGKELAKFTQIYAKVKGPYFPLVRIGNYYAVGMSARVAELTAKKEAGTISSAESEELSKLRQNKAHYTTSSYATEAQAKKAADALKATYKVAKYNVVEERLGGHDLTLPGLPQLEAYINAEMPADVRGEIKDLVAKLAFEMAPEGSALKRMMKREGVAGYDTDMRKVFATTAMSQAHYISRLKHNADVSAALVSLSQEGRSDMEMRHVYNEMVARTKLAHTKESHPLVDRLLNLSYFGHLGVSPAFVLTNMTQVPMVTLPWLGARHGFGRASTAIAKAYGDVFGIIKTSVKKDGWRSELDWKHAFKQGSDEDKLFSTLLDRNLLDITMEHDLGVVAEMGGTSKLGDLAKFVNTPVRVTEYANRAVTALAAYRLARDNGMAHEAAVEQAAKAVSQTQMDYSGINAARHMQSVLGSKALGKMMFQFRKYQQGMLWLLAHNIAQAVKGGTAEEKATARRFLLGMAGMTGTFAGTLGLPFIGSLGAVANIIAYIAGSPDDPWDWEEELRNTYADWFGAEMGQVMAKGVLTTVGLDLSQRIGLGTVASPLPYAKMGNNGRETVGNVLSALGGASMGTVADFYDGIVALAGGDVAKGAEKIIPLKVAKDVVKAASLSADGLVDSRHHTVLSSDAFSPWDIALRGAGFSPMKVSEYYSANEKVQSAKHAAEDVRRKLTGEYARAQLAGEDAADIRAKVQSFNERHPEKGVRIDHSALIKAVQQERKLAQERNAAGIRTDKRTKPYADRGDFAID